MLMERDPIHEDKLLYVWQCCVLPLDTAYYLNLTSRNPVSSCLMLLLPNYTRARAHTYAHSDLYVSVYVFCCFVVTIPFLLRFFRECASRHPFLRRTAAAKRTNWNQRFIDRVAKQKTQRRKKITKKNL